MSFPQHRKTAGFTLIEILVGMAIALIGMVMMFQVMSVWEARKRTASSGSDAQVSGSIAMFSLERDISLAGFGFGNASAMGCAVSAYDSARTAPGTFSFRMAPVFITDNGGAPDTLAVLYGSATTMSANQTFSAFNAGSMSINSRTGLRNGDLVIGADSGNTLCGLFEVTSNNNTDAVSIAFGTGAYTNYASNNNVAAQSTLSAGDMALLQTKFLNNSGTARFNNGTNLSVGGSGAVFNMGAAPRLNLWQITNGRFLTVSNLLVNELSTNPTEVSEGVVNLQAEYGIDINNDGLIAAGEWTTTTPSNAATWGQLRSVRVALLARSQQFEAAEVTADPPTWTGGAFSMTNLDASAASNDDTPNDWRHYRYRVYETVIPLRNMQWGID